MSLSGSVKMLKSSGCNLSDSGSTRSTKFRFLSWSPETYPLREFINAFPLPRVVRITNSEDAALLKALILPADVDITQPLLLYKKYRTVKVMGKCLKIQKNGKLKENGPCVVIPDSFPGWFTLLNQEGKECAMTLTSMGQVAAARVPAFLTKFDVPVYKLTDSNDPNSKSVYVRSTMKGGSILRLLGVWADLGGANKGFTAPPSSSYSAQKSSCFLGGSLGGFGGRLVARSLSSPQPPQFQYVQCLSLENEVLFVPFSAAGVFYPIAPRGGRNPQHVYPLSAIARISRLPLRTRMVFGAAPTSLPDFTGALQIESVDTEDVILACTLLRDKPILFEVDLECDLSLSQMTSEDLFIQSTSYQAALSFCKTEGDNWRRQIRPTLWGKNTTKGGTVSGAYVLSVKEKKKSLRLSSSQTPSKLSLLFRPNSAPFGNAKDLLRRSKSFNVEVQSVSISLTQDEEEEETKKLSTLFNFMAGKKSKNAAKEKLQQQQQQQHQLQLQQTQCQKHHVPVAPPSLLSPPSHHRHLYSFSEQPLSLPCNIMTSEKDRQNDKDQQELVVEHSHVSKLPQPVQQHGKKLSTTQLSSSHQALNKSSQHLQQKLSHNNIHAQSYHVQQPASKKLQIFNQPKSISNLSNNYHHALRRRQLINRSVPDVLSDHNSSSSSSIPAITTSNSTSNNNINNTNHHTNQTINGSSSYFSNNNRISIITGSNGSSSIGGSSSCSNICSSSSFPSSNNSTGYSSSSSISGPCSKIIISNGKKVVSSSSASNLTSSSINNSGCTNSNVAKTSCTGSHHLLHIHAASGGHGHGNGHGHHAKGGSSSNKGSNGEVPYGTVLDDVTEEENIYAEISDAFTLKLDLNPIHQMGIDFHHHLHRHTNSSNMSSLVKGGGGSDGAFSGTLSGTFSSSNPSSREEDIYDAVF